MAGETDLTELIKAFGVAVKKEVAKGFASITSALFSPKGYVEVPKKYGTEAAPIPPLSIVALTAVNPVSSAVGYGEFIGEEAMQMTGFGLMGLIRNEEYQAAYYVLQQLKQLWKYCMTFHEVLGPLNPLTYVTFGLNFKAVAAMALAYEVIITKNLDASWKERYEEIREWYQQAKEDLKAWLDAELEPFKADRYAKKARLRSEHRRNLTKLRNALRRGKISQETYWEVYTKAYKIYFKLRRMIDKMYEAEIEPILEKYREKRKALYDEYLAKLTKLNEELIVAIMKSDPEIYGYMLKDLSEIARAVTEKMPEVKRAAKELEIEVKPKLPEMPKVVAPAPAPAKPPAPKVAAPPAPKLKPREEIKRIVERLKEEHPEKKYIWVYSGLNPPDEKDIASMKELGYKLARVKSYVGVGGKTIYYAIWEKGD